MKALTLHQPWASLIAHSVKTIETRSWAPPRRFIGQRIAIHAGMERGVAGKLDPTTHRAIMELYGVDWAKSMPRGAVVATALLSNTYQVKIRTGERVSLAGASHQLVADAYGDFSPGRWLWMLADVERLEPPFPVSGQQRLWDWHPAGAAV